MECVHNHDGQQSVGKEKKFIISSTKLQSGEILHLHTLTYDLWVATESVQVAASSWQWIIFLRR